MSTSFARKYFVIFAILCFVAVFRLAGVWGKPSSLLLPNAVLKEGQKEIVSNRLTCPELKSIKTCNGKKFDYRFFLCGPESSDKIDNVYVVKEDKDPRTHTFRPVSPDSPRESRFKPYDGSLNSCPEE